MLSVEKKRLVSMQAKVAAHYGEKGEELEACEVKRTTLRANVVKTFEVEGK
jgi:hypothetical protein